MIISKITPIVNSTAETTHFSTEIVADVVKHMFKSIGAYLQKPDKAGLRLTYLGVIRPHKNAIDNYLRRLIADMRLKPEKEELKEEFRTF